MSDMETCWRSVGVYGGDRSCPQLREHVHCRSCPVFSQAGRALLDRPKPSSLREEALRIVSLPPPTVSRTCGVLIFRIGTEWFGLPLKALVEVTEMRPTHRVPHRSHRILSGIVNVRGQLLLCVSMHGLLELQSPTPFNDKARIVHFTTGREDWTFAADEVFGIADINESSMRSAPVSVALRSGACSTSVFDHHGKHVAMLDVSRIGDELRREVG
jgi:chemotaxis-related protein WspD